MQNAHDTATKTETGITVLFSDGTTIDINTATARKATHIVVGYHSYWDTQTIYTLNSRLDISEKALIEAQKNNPSTNDFRILTVK